LQSQHRPFVPLDRPLDETVGERLAAWARGATAHTGPTPANRTAAPPPGAAQGMAGGGTGIGQPITPPAVSDLDAAEPIALDIFPGADDAEWKAHGVMLRSLIAGAPSYGTAAMWWQLNEAQFRGRSAKLADWIAKAVPSLTDADEGGAVSLDPAAAQTAPIERPSSASLNGAGL